MCPAHDVGSDLLQLAGLDRPHEYVPLGRREPHQVAPSRRCGPRALPRASPGGATGCAFRGLSLGFGREVSPRGGPSSPSGAMGNELTLEELAELTAAPADQLREWRSLGLIGRESAETFRPEDVQRIRLIQLLLRRGIGLAAIARVEQEQGFLSRYIDVMFPAGVRAIYSLAEVNRMLGMDSGSVRRFWEAAGLGDRGDLLDEEDVQALKAIRVLVEAGLPEEALVQLAHVYADALGRVAEAEARLFHFYVHERLKATGMSERELMQASDAARGQTAPLIEPLILYFHRKGLERAVREDAVMHLQEDVGLASPAELPGQLWVAILFVDLASFTPM